jgi:hypothetical protein
MAGFIESETTFEGKVFFSAKPKLGRTSIGRAAGAFLHTDTYQSALHPFVFPEGAIKVTPLTAKYTPGQGAVRLDVVAVVSSVTGPVYSQDYDEHSTQGGDGARVIGYYDFPSHRDDSLQTLFGCSQCKGSSTGLGVHGHRFLVEPEDKLRVSISAPRQLSGACRCRGTIN